MPLNFSTYVFVLTDTEYAQYPSDGLGAIIKSWRWALSHEEQIALHREGNLLYCCYFRKLEGVSEAWNGSVGLAVCFNGVGCRDMETMLSIFGETITTMTISGRVVEFSDRGVLRLSGSSVFIRRDDADFVQSALSYKVQQLPRSAFFPLPPINYSISPLKTETCPLEDCKAKIPSLMKDFCRILVPNDSGAVSGDFATYSKRIADLDKANSDLVSEKEALSEEVKTLTRQKKQYKGMTIFGIIALVLLIVSIVFISDSATKKQEIEQYVSEIRSLKNDIAGKESTIDDLQKDLRDRDNKIRTAESFLSSFTSETLCPFTISDIQLKTDGTSYGEPIPAATNTYIYPIMTVRSLVSGTAELTVKFYSPYGLSTSSSASYGQDYSYKSTIELKKNQTNIVTVSGWGGADKGHWRAGVYTIEFYYGKVFVGKKSFTIR